MIEYVYPNNIDDRILDRAAGTMKSGGLVAHPTDTSWHISCALSSPLGFSRLKSLKAGAHGYLFTLMILNISQVSDLADVTTSRYKIIHRYTPGPFVFIVESRKALEKMIGEKRKHIGIRIPSDPVSRAVLEALGEPMFSTTAARSMEDVGWWDDVFAEENLFEMGWELEGISGIGMILDTGEAVSKTLTTVLDLSSKEVVVIRQGIGDYQ